MSDFSRKIRNFGHVVFTSPPGNNWLALGPGCHLGAGQVFSSLPVPTPAYHLPITSLSTPSCPFDTALSHLYLPGNKDDVNHGLYFPCIFVKYVLFCVHVILVYTNSFMLYISFSSFVPTLSTRSFTSILLSRWLCGTPCCVSSTSHLSTCPPVDPDPASSIHPPHHKKCCCEPPHTCPLVDLAEELLGLYTQKQNHWVEGCMDS